MEEKKEIKISLFSFYVLVAGIVVLIGSLLIAGFVIIQNSSEDYSANNIANSGEQTGNTEKRELLANGGIWIEGFDMYEFPTISNYPNMQNLLEAFGLEFQKGGDMGFVGMNLNNISNADIFEIAVRIATPVDYGTTDYYTMYDKFVDETLLADGNVEFYTAASIENAVVKIFGNKVPYKHADWENNSFQYPDRERATYSDEIYTVYSPYWDGYIYYSYTLQDITKIEQVGNKVEITVKMADLIWDDSVYKSYENSTATKIGYNIYNFRKNNIGKVEWIMSVVGDYGHGEDINFIRQNPSKVDTFKYTFSQDQEDGNYYFESFNIVK